MTPDPIREARKATDKSRYQMDCDGGAWFVVTTDFVEAERALVDARLRVLEEALLKARVLAMPHLWPNDNGPDSWVCGGCDASAEMPHKDRLKHEENCKFLIIESALTPAQPEKGERG